jgi:hypothetical protein
MKSGALIQRWDAYGPTQSWVDADHSVVGGNMPPGAVSAQVSGVRGDRVQAQVGQGVFAAVLNEPTNGREPAVCFRDASGIPVRRPLPGTYPTTPVTDARDRCPACDSLDWEVYTPFEQWRGGRGSKVDGTNVPNPVVSCRVCGYEETEPTFFGPWTTAKDDPDEDEELRRPRRLAEFRARRWHQDASTLRAADFGIYVLENWPAHMVGSGSRDGRLDHIKVAHFDSPDASPSAGDRPRVEIESTPNSTDYHRDLLTDARDTHELWIRNASQERWIDASTAAITLWSRARERNARAEMLDATRSHIQITIEGTPRPALTLTSPSRRSVTVVEHSDMTITIAAHDLDPATLSLTPLADPIDQLLGSEPDTP